MHKTIGLRARKNAAVKASMYEAAMALFAEQGFDATSVDQIAERAGVGRATFFNHFGTKEGVLRHFGHQMHDQVEVMLASMDRTLPPLDRLRQVLSTIIGAVQSRRDEIRLIYRYSLNDPSYPNLTPARERIWALGTHLIEEAQQAGQVRTDISAREIAFHALDIMQNAMLANVFAGEPLEPLIESGWKILLGGILHASGTTGPNPQG